MTRVVAARAGPLDRLGGLRRMGIDEISHHVGQRYLLVATDHDTRQLVRAGKKRLPVYPGAFATFHAKAADQAHAAAMPDTAWPASKRASASFIPEP